MNANRSYPQRFSLAVGLLLLFLLSVPVQAKDSDPPGHSAALFLTGDDTVDAEALKAISDGFARIAEKCPDLTLISGAELRLRLEREPRGAIAKCGGDLECIAQLGQKVVTTEVVYGLVNTLEKAGGFQIRLLVVGTDSNTVVRRVKFELASLEQTEIGLREHFYDAFGVVVPPEQDTDVAQLPGGGNENPALGAGNEAGTWEPPLLAVGPDSTGQKPAVADKAAAPLSSGRSAVGTSKDVVASAPTATRQQRPEATGMTSRDWCLYGGIGVGGAGAILTGAGAFFGAASRSNRSSAERSSIQRDAVRHEGDSNTAAGRANGLFWVGGALFLAGSALVGVSFIKPDLFEAASATVIATDGGARGSVVLLW